MIVEKKTDLLHFPTPLTFQWRANCERWIRVANGAENVRLGGMAENSIHGIL